jgi:TPP-dependent pyruvate/acetoin dehydrogenase alpha subunit
MRSEIETEIQKAFDFARNSPYPDPSFENPSAYAGLSK